MPYNDGWVDVPKGAHDDGWVDVADDRTTQIARGAKMTNAEADQYMQNRARFASEGGASTFGKGGATDTRKISYTGTGYRPNKKATSGKELAKNFVQDVVELPLMPVRMASEVANSPDTPQTLADMGKGLVTTPMGFVPGLSDLATGKPASENWLTNPGIGALTVLGGAEIARQGVPKLADLASDRIASSELLNPERLARSALKPYNGEQIARQKAVTRGLETAVSDPNATPRMSKFLEKNLSEMDDIAGRQEVLLDEKGNPRVSIKGVRDSLQGTVDAARETPGTADSAVTAAERVLNDIISHPEYDAATDSIPLNTVQTMKKNIWRKLREGNTFNKDAVPGLQDAMWDAATGMNSIINEFIPEMKAENARYGELANVNKLLKKAADRHAGNNLVPLRAMIQLARGDVQGFMQGATMWAVDHPTFKMYLAQRLAKVRGKKATPTEINNITDAIKENLIQRQQTVLDSEALPKVSNGNLGDTIDPTAYSPQYGWEGKAPAAPEVANPEVLPPRQSSQMPVISDQGGRIVPQVEAMTKRVPAGFNPEVIGMGTEDVQLGDRMAPKPRPLRGLADLAPQEAPQPPKTDAHPWRQYVAENMGRAMKEEGSHGAAMKKLAKEWGEIKRQQGVSGNKSE